jgi:hypothetical protein
MSRMCKRSVVERSWNSHVTSEDFETNEGETEDLYDKLMDITVWKVTDNNDLT